MTGFGLPPGVSVAGAVRVRVPLQRPVATSRGAWEAVDSWLLRLEDADGRSGLGEATLGQGATSTDQAVLDELVRASARGRPGPARGAAGMGPARSALASGVGGALLDLGSAPDGRPRAARVTLNATIGAEGLDACLAAARAAVAAGFRTLKLKGGTERSAEELAARLAAVREVVGPDVALRLDVNGAWDAATALARLAAVAGLGLDYVEQPVPADDLAGLARVRAGSPGVPVAADEAVVDRAAAQRLLASAAVDVLVVKPARVGGPAEALAIAADAAAMGVGVTISTLLETGVGLAAAIVTASLLPAPGGGAHGLATGGLLVSDLLAGGTRGSGPEVAVPPGPGLGIAVDPAAVARFTLERVGDWP